VERNARTFGAAEHRADAVQVRLHDTGHFVGKGEGLPADDTPRSRRDRILNLAFMRGGVLASTDWNPDMVSWT
jgi:hypothetical protein